MKKIAVVTTTRAEFGLLFPVISELRKYEEDNYRIELIVSGTHLSDQYGFTISEIDTETVRIDHRIVIPVASNSELDISNNQAETLKRFSELFLAEKYRAVILLGDRYETLAIAIAAGNTHTPIFHLCGGDTTEGAMDEWIRHSITKMSYLHFVTNEDSRRRVIQLGESPGRVFNYGSTSIDNINRTDLLSKEDALRSINLDDCQYALCTYHPVTMDANDVDELILMLMKVIKELEEIQFIVTKSNADQGGMRINKLLGEAEKNLSNLHLYSSLGVKRYLSLMRYTEFVIGNSSSGIIEAPAFGIPTVNIGNRQRGRLRSASIIDCGENEKDILNAVRKAISPVFKAKCRKVESPYGHGHTGEKIAKKVIETVDDGFIDLKKSFFNLQFEEIL